MDQSYVIRERNFIGYNDQKGADLLTTGYLSDALNCFIRTGELVKRTGYTIIGADLALSKACQGAAGIRFANGTEEIVAVFNGSIYKSTGGNFSLITSGSGVLSTSAYVDIVMANNAVYFFDGVSTVPKYNGTAISTVAAIPIGTTAKWLHNQLHVVGISGSPNKLQSSDIGDPETFTGGNSSNLDVNPNDSDYITALDIMDDELFVFKRNRVWAATGFGTTALTLAGIRERLSGFGAVGKRATINTGNDILYLGFLGDRPVIRSLKRTSYGQILDGGIISNDIETTMNGLNKAQLSKTATMFDGVHVWFAVPNGSSTTNNLVLTYNTVTKGWTRHTGINASVFFQSAVSGQNKLYFGEATANSKAYLFDTSTSDNGTAINFSVTSRRYGGMEPEIKKKFKYLYSHVQESGNYNLTVDYSKDGFTYENLDTINLSGTGATFGTAIFGTSKFGSTDTKTQRSEIAKSRSRYAQFKYYDTSSTSSVRIRQWELIYQKKLPIEA